MNYNFKLENDVLTVSLDGRLDTEAAVAFETELAVKSKENPHGIMVIFPNIQNIVGGVKYMVSVIDNIHKA